jgi:hypothetical protein
MNTIIFGLPLWLILVLGVPLISFVVYLIIRAMREGREISFWQIRIGPRVTNPASEPKKIQKDNNKRLEDQRPIKLKDEKAKEVSSKGIKQIDFDLPGKTYSTLFGREKELDAIIDVLQDPRGKRIVSISGLGGIGKTALANEVAEKCRNNGQYHKVLWRSAKEETISGGKIQLLTSSSVSFESILNDMANLLEKPEIVREKDLDKKRIRIKSLLELTPCLIVVDNLETVKNYEALVMKLAGVTTSLSRVVITSRHQLVDYDEAYCISLEGLLETEAIAFIRQEARERGITTIAPVEDTTLSKLSRAAGGAPLALKLAVGQLSRLSIETVLQNLQAAKGDMENLYIFVFRTTWKLLSQDARKILIAMPAIPSSAARSAIERVSTVDHARLTDALSELVIVSLIDVSNDISDSKKRYSIHSLTRNFLNTELREKWT